MVQDTIGFLGVGHLASHLVPGLLRDDDAPGIVLSPRNKQTVMRLASAPGVTVARDNISLVEKCSMVLLGVRPFDAIATICELPWRDGQVLVSLCAGVSLDDLVPAAAPARVVRAMPVIAAQFGHSPTCIYPQDDRVAALFSRCGTVLELEEESQFDIATVMACHSSALLTLIATMAHWNDKAGLDAEMARRLAAETMRAAAETALGRCDVTMNDLIAELTLPGSATGAGIDRIRELGGLDCWREANDTVLRHVQGPQMRPNY